MSPTNRITDYFPESDSGDARNDYGSACAFLDDDATSESDKVVIVLSDDGSLWKMFSPIQGVHVWLDSGVTDRFHLLASQWKRETAHLSRLDQIYLHPAYQQIIGMGRPAIPFIIDELIRSGGRWFGALKAITGQEPLAGQRGVGYDELRSAWIQWAREHEYGGE